MMGLFIPALLTSAYGFPDDTKNIIAVRKINGSSIGEKGNSRVYVCMLIFIPPCIQLLFRGLNLFGEESVINQVQRQSPSLYCKQILINIANQHNLDVKLISIFDPSARFSHLFRTIIMHLNR